MKAPWGLEDCDCGHTIEKLREVLGRLLRCLPDDLGRCSVCDGLGGWHTAHCGLVAQARADIKGAKP